MSRSLWISNMQVIYKNLGDLSLGDLTTLSKHCLQQLKLVMDSIIWAFRHTERNVAETGLNLLLEMLTNFQVSCHQTLPSYENHLKLMQIFFVVTLDATSILSSKLNLVWVFWTGFRILQPVPPELFSNYWARNFCCSDWYLPQARVQAACAHSTAFVSSGRSLCFLVSSNFYTCWTYFTLYLLCSRVWEIRLL